MHRLASRALAAGIALAVSGAAGAQVVISQVYGGAGQSGARYNADFVELHNNGNAAVDLSGWSLHYTPLSGAYGWQRTPLSGVIAPGGYFLVRQRVSTGSTALSAYDLTGNVSLNHLTGKLALVNHASPIAVSCPTGSVDFLGYGSVDCAEGSATAPAGGLVTAQLRRDGGCVDTQANSIDFALGAPTPRTRNSARRVCPPGPPPRLSAIDVTQGEGQDGIASFVFRLKLDRPAGADGVSWSAFSNGQGSATPDQDYLPIDLRGSIAPGQTETAFALPVKGDLLSEGDETVVLQIKVHSGAVTANGDYLNLQATIVDDDPQPLPPRLSLHSNAINEGDLDIAPFPIELRLDRPAGSGGVRVRLSSAEGGSATIHEDYLPFDYEAMIGPGQDRAHVSFGVRGDTRYEGDETVRIKAQILSGAIADDGSANLEGLVTIVDDDLRVVPIAAVQGREAVSPLRGEFVSVEGLVTALSDDGFYLQSEEFESDGDPQTSQGLFVQTGHRPDPQWRGLRVRASGMVAELSERGSHPLRGSMTAIAGSPAIVLLTSSPRPLPPAPLLPWQPYGAPDYEAFEGMRVGLPEVRVVGPTGGSFDAVQDRTRSDGRFHVALGGADQPAPMREPGTRYRPFFHGQPQDWLPRWDGNPEVIGVDSDGDGHAPLDVAIDSRIDGVIGPLDQRSGRYTVALQHDAQLIVRPPLPAPPRIEPGDPQQRQVAVVSYDLGDLFDEYSPPGSAQPTTPLPALERRLGKISRSLRESLLMPDLVAIAGIENEALLQRLAERINRDASASGSADPRYRAIALPNVDPLKPHLGLLARSEQVGGWGSRVVVEHIAQIGRDAPLPNSGGSPSPLLFDQAPLSVDATIQSSDGHRFRQRLLLVQLAPMVGSEADTPEAERQRDRRHLQAEFIAGWVRQQQSDPDAPPLLLLGRFDAHAFNDGLVDPIGTLTGRPTEGVSTMVLGDGVDRFDPDLLRLAATEPESERYSSIDEGSRQELQHAFADERLIGATDRIEVQRLRSNAGYPAVMRDAQDSPIRAGDVDPLHLRLVPRTRADLSVWAGPMSGDTLEAGRPLELSVSVDNAGPDWARQVGLGLALSGAWPNLEVSAVAPGWRCAAPVVEGDHTSLACTGESVDSTGHVSQWFHLRAATEASMAGRTVELAASVTSPSADPDPADNAARTSLRILAPGGAPQP